MGRVSDCDDPAYNTKLECLEAGHEWVVPNDNYNHIGRSMLVFFEVSTLEMWPDIMFRAVNSPAEQDVGMTEGARPHFISVIVSQFNKQKMKNERSNDLTDEQREWVKIQRYMCEVNPPVDSTRPMGFRGRVYDLCEKPAFEYFITAVIVANTILLCMDYYGAGERYVSVMDLINNVFMWIFTAEAFLKILGYGPKYYWYIDWNRFDFIIVILSLMSSNEQLAELFSFNLTALRIIRVARLLRMIKASKEL
jgi:hypothetical protein